MRKLEIRMGGCYVAKVSKVSTVVEIVSESPYGGWNARNLRTGRDVRIRSGARLRRRATDAEVVNASRRTRR